MPSSSSSSSPLSPTQAMDSSPRSSSSSSPKRKVQQQHRRRESKGLQPATHSSVTIVLEEDNPPKKNKSNNNNSSSSSRNNKIESSKENKKKHKRSKNNKNNNSKAKHSWQSEPSGFVGNTNTTTTTGRGYGEAPAGAAEDGYYLDNERNPLTATAGEEKHQPHSACDDNHLMEESELFDDTFTFLMTGSYPFDFCCQSKESSRTAHSKEEEEQEFTVEEDNEMQTKASKGVGMVSATMNSLLDDVDPDYLCLPFWTGIFVITSQFFIYTVVMANVFQRNTLPPNADTWLRLAQIFAVLVTLYTQSDFIDGIFLVTERWKAFHEVTTPLKFNFSAILRVIAGNVGIISTFVLVMYSTEVVDLLLNFTAMEFVATLDDSAFEVASKGFLGVTLEKKCLLIQEFRYHRRMRRGSWARILLYIFYIILVFGGFLTIVTLQATRSVGVDNQVYVQFDDSDVLELFGISGVYQGCQHFKSKETGRIGYIDIGLECPSKNLNGEFPARSFLYCWDLEGYVYIDQKTDKPCQEGNFLIRSFLDEASIAANSFDILTHAKANWVISGSKTKSGSQSLLTNFIIDSVYTIQGNFKNCGKESLGLVDFFPHSRRPYRPLDFSDTFYPSVEDKAGNGRLYSELFDLIYRPIYVRPICGHINRYQMVFFDGLRWNYVRFNPVAYAESIGRISECGKIQTTNQELDCKVDYPNDTGCWKVFTKYFHSDVTWRSNYTVAVHEAISAPMMILSPTDFGIPTAQLTWFEAEVVEGRVETGKAYVTGGVDNNEDDDDDDDNNFGEEEIAPLFQCAASFDAECGDDELQLTVSVTTDTFASETRVLAFYGRDLSEITKVAETHEVLFPVLRDKFTITHNVLTELEFDERKSTFILGACVPMKERCIQILIGDTDGDGILLPGEYAFQYGDDPSVGDRSGDNFVCRSYHFGAGCANSGLEQGSNCDAILADIPKPDVEEEDTPQNDPSDFYDPSDTVTFVPSTFGTGSEDFEFGTAVPTLDLFCLENEIELLVQVTTDAFSSETSVLLFFGQSLDDIADLTVTRQITFAAQAGKVEIAEGLLSHLFFTDFFTTYLSGTCIPPSAQCIQIVALDSFGDGFSPPGSYTFSYGTEDLVSADDSGWGCRSYQFGPGCINTPSSIPSDCSLSALATILPESVTDEFI